MRLGLEEYERRFRLLDDQMRVLERERQKLSGIVNNSGAGFLVAGRDGTVDWVNRVFVERFCALPGATPLPGMPCHRILCGQDRPCVTCPAAGPFREGRVTRQEMSLVVGGDPRHVYATAIPITSPQGQIEQAVVMLQDVSDLEILRKSEVRKAAILDSAIDAIISMDHEGRITEFNRAAEGLFGYRRSEAVGRALADLLIPPAFRQRHRDGLARYLATGEAQFLGRLLEITAVRADGTEFPVEVRIDRVPLPGLPQFTGHIRDLTDRRKTEEALRASEEQLRHAQKMEAIGRLAGGVAHDFNNLLTVINGRCQLLLRALEGPALRREVESVREAAERAGALTRQLLAFSRRQVLQPRVLDLRRVIEGMEGMLRRLIGEDVGVEIRSGAEPCVAKADPGQIEQVIMNLALNARDAMPQGGRILIEVGRVDLDEPQEWTRGRIEPGRFVCLTVTDSGCGMAGDQMTHLFEPFFTTKEKGRGTGLGLPTVYGIVQQSGGQIGVRSAAGAGSAFAIFLPRLEEEAIQGAPAAGRAAEAVPQTGPTPIRERSADVRGHGETILLVEDEEAVRDVSRVILESHGYTVLVANDGEEGLSLARAHAAPIHLLLTDLVMPRMNGRALAEALAPVRRDMKILYMSGYTDDAAILRDARASGTAFLQKPFTLEALLETVRRLLDARLPG